MCPAYKRKLKKGVRWRFVGSYLGVQYASKSIYLTKKEAQDAERKRIKKIDDEIRNPSSDIPLYDLFNHRLNNLELVRNREYYEDNRRLLKHTLKVWGRINASQVTKRMVADILLQEVKRCRREKLGNSRPNQLLKVLKATFNYANNTLGLEVKNPCNGISKLPEDEKIKFIPSEEMIEAVKNKCNDEQKELVEFAYFTGARINECLNLTYHDFTETHVVLYTRKSRNSNRIPRLVPKPDWLNSLGTGRVFKTWEAYPRFLEVYVRDLKQPTWNWHCLRHRRASIWANEGRPLFEIMSLLGHTQISTTQRYLHSLGIVRL